MSVFPPFRLTASALIARRTAATAHWRRVAFQVLSSWIAEERPLFTGQLTISYRNGNPQDLSWDPIPEKKGD
jgi:hypothetical protein